MKRYFCFLIGAILSLCNCSAPIYVTKTVTTQPAAPPEQYNNGYDNGSVGYDAFYNQLSPYGTWIDYPDYGYVWSPNTGPDFRPYATNGHWVYTDYGWTWYSDYDWGWATFHYGRWFYEDGYGWLWKPGKEWAPAWVTWGQSGDYYGWAPIAPNVPNENNWQPPQHYWNFVPAKQVTNVNVNNYVVNTTNNVTVVNNITNNVTIINNVNNVTNNNATNNVTNNNIVNNKTVYNGGPKVKDVERATNSPVQHVVINQSAKAGGSSLSGNQLTIYHPVVKATANGDVKPIPTNVQTYHPASRGNNQNAGRNNDVSPQNAGNPVPTAEKPVTQPIKPIQQQPVNTNQNNYYHTVQQPVQPVIHQPQAPGSSNNNQINNPNKPVAPLVVKPTNPIIVQPHNTNQNGNSQQKPQVRPVIVPANNAPAKPANPKQPKPQKNNKSDSLRMIHRANN